MRTKHLVIATFVLLISSQINLLSVEARHIEATYKSCALMNRKYPTGVAISSAVAKKYPAKISRSVYISNVKLDFDDDGVVCEKESLQKSLNGPGVTTTTVSNIGDSNLYIFPPRQPANPFILI